MKNRSLAIKRLAYSGLFLALALVLPFLTGQIPQVGSALLPMHLPVLLCGFICGGGWGAAVGFAAPLLRHLLFAMPPMPGALSMAFELATYALVAGLLYKRLPRTLPWLYADLLAAMVAGRLVWGAVSFAIAGLRGAQFPFAVFWAGAVVNAIPGIICQLILIPILVRALSKNRMALNG